MNNSDHLQTIGGNIRIARKVKGWTQQQLADEAGLRLATISDIETGKLNFEMNTLVKIAKALGFVLDINFKPVRKK